VNERKLREALLSSLASYFMDVSRAAGVVDVCGGVGQRATERLRAMKKQMEARRPRLDEKRGRLIELVTDGTLSKADFTEGLAKVDEELLQLESQLEAVEAQLEASSAPEAGVLAGIVLQKIEAIDDDPTDRERVKRNRALLKSILHDGHVVVTPVEGTREVIVECVPVLPSFSVPAAGSTPSGSRQGSNGAKPSSASAMAPHSGAPTNSSYREPSPRATVRSPRSRFCRGFAGVPGARS